MSVNLWKRILGVLACLALLGTLVLALPLPLPAQTEPVEAQALMDADFTLLHTNDEHSEVIPADVSIDFPDYPTIGGLSRIANEIGRIEAEKAAVSEPVVVTSSGDFSQGTFFAWLETMAAAELSLMEGIGYDVVSIGNHELEEGAGYRALALQAAIDAGVTLPVLSSNMRFDDTDPEAAALQAYWSDEDLEGAALAIQPYTIKDLGNGLQLGFFNLMGVEAEAVAPMAAATGITFGNVYNPDGSLNMESSFLARVFKAQDMVNQLRLQGCDVVVCLSHMGTTEELMLCDYVSGLDVILGGHSHSLNYPPIIKNGIIVVQAGAYTKYLGELELNYKETENPVTHVVTGAVSVRNGQAIRIDESVPTVPPIDAWIANYVAAIDGILGAVLGTNMMDPYAETDFFGDGGFNLNEGPSFTETNLGNLITDSYVMAGSLNPNFIGDAAPVQLGIEANGVIRSGVLKGGEGIFNAYDLYRTLPLGATPDSTQVPPLGIPFGYPLCSFYLLGAEIQGALDATLGMGDNQFFLQMSGGRYTWRPAGGDGNRVASFELEDGAGGYVPIQPMGLYKIATNFYTASFLELFGLYPRDSAYNQLKVNGAYLSRVMVGASPTVEIKAWQALFGYVGMMPDTDGDGIPNIPNPQTLPLIPVQYRFPQGRISTVDWNMAEGATDGGMETFVLVQNPDATDAHVNVIFLTATGEVAPSELQGVTIPAQSRVTFKANDYVDSFDVSTQVEPIDGFVVCERSVYGNGRTWGTDSIGVTAPSPSAQWYFAEGSTAGGMETWLLVENPNTSDVHVDVTLMTSTGPEVPAALQDAVIPAQSRRSFRLSDYLIDYEVSAYVEAQDGTVVCERSMYGGGAWGTDSIGAIAPSSTWFLAEGSTMGGMETFVLAQNPGLTDVHADISFQTENGLVEPPELQGVTIPALSRRTFKVNDYVSTYDVSTLVLCLDGELVCERAMYGNDRAWAHASIGAPDIGVDWYMAEGSTGGGMETFVLIQNPLPADSVVDVTFQTGSGPVAPPALQGLTIPANSRFTINVGDYVPGEFDVSTHVVAVGGAVVCERAMYGNGRTWGTESIGFMR